jgi:hypothetical protein
MPKKATPKKKKLVPTQAFVAISYTRAEIAEELNSIAQNEGWDNPKFTKDDPRLTDEVCQDIVDGVQSAYCDVDENVDRAYMYNKEDLRCLLGIPEQDEEEDDE